MLPNRTTSNVPCDLCSASNHLPSVFKVDIKVCHIGNFWHQRNFGQDKEHSVLISQMRNHHYLYDFCSVIWYTSLFAIMQHQSMKFKKGMTLVKTYWLHSLKANFNHWSEKVVVYSWQFIHFWMGWMPWKSWSDEAI